MQAPRLAAQEEDRSDCGFHHHDAGNIADIARATRRALITVIARSKATKQSSFSTVEKSWIASALAVIEFVDRDVDAKGQDSGPVQEKAAETEAA